MKNTIGMIRSHFLRVHLALMVTVWGLFNTQAATAKSLLVYGDSLSAAYGMELEVGWVSILAQRLQDEIKIGNASISGETTVGGLARLPSTLEELNPEILMIELGANDGLRGYPVSKIKENISSMVDLAKQRDILVIIAGISLPASYGPRYIDQFVSVFRELADENEVLYFNLYDQQYVTTPGLIQEDGLHPTEKAQELIADKVQAFLEQSNIIEKQ